MAVYNANNLDIEAKKKDGTVELYIISSGKFDDSPEQQTLLMDKVENYIGYILSDEFKSNYPSCPKEKACIILSLAKKPSDLLLELCRRIRTWVNSYEISFRVEYKSVFRGKQTINL